MLRIGACPQSHFKLSYPVTAHAIKLLVPNEKHFQRRGYHFHKRAALHCRRDVETLNSGIVKLIILIQMLISGLQLKFNEGRTNHSYDSFFRSFINSTKVICYLQAL